MTTETDTLLGTVLGGRWRLTRKLGEGGMGAVYCGEGIAGEGEFAVKILHKEFVKEEQVVSRFYAEAEASKRLHHPNIARIYESGTAETGEPYLLMELLRGQPLADANPDGSRMEVGRAVVIMKEVLVALTEAHRQDIVHRDLKPDNIFLCNQPDGSQIAKLLDFGIARVIDAANGGAMRKTKTGMLLGTPGYMSPEQLRNSKSVDPRSDLWSLCTVFYELLSGRDPYGATNDFARLTAVFTQESIPVDRDAPDLAPWREFFVRSFMRDINQRFQSAGEMSAAIDAVVNGQPLPPPAAPIQPPAPPASEVAKPASQVHTQVQPQAQAADPLASTQLAGLTLPAHLAAAQPQASSHATLHSSPQAQPPAAPNPSTPPPAAAGSSKLVWGLIAAVLVLGAIIAGLAIKSMQQGKEERPKGDAQPTAQPSAGPAKTTPPGPGKKK